MEKTQDITPVRLGPNPPWWYILFRLFLKAAVRILFRVRVVGKANIPQGNYIVIANHLSWIDPFLLMMVLPARPRLYFIGPVQALNQGWKAWMLRTFDIMVAFARGASWQGTQMFKTSLAVLQDGAILGLFPEGQIGPREGELQPLQRGIGHLVLRGGRPVLPIALSGTRELYLGKPVTITVGEPFCVNSEGSDRHAEVDAAVEQIGRELRRTIPPYIEPHPRIKVWRRLTYLLDQTPPP